jgi:hypothetical protein
MVCHYDYLNSRRNGDITVEFVSVTEAEMDGDKSHQYWLWRAIDHTTGEPLAFHHYGRGVPV